jgi:hypothetical protein
MLSLTMIVCPSSRCKRRVVVHLVKMLAAPFPLFPRHVHVHPRVSPSLQEPKRNVGWYVPGQLAGWVRSCVDVTTYNRLIANSSLLQEGEGCLSTYT